MIRTFFLSRHVYLRVISGQVIFFDVRNEDYVALQSKQVFAPDPAPPHGLQVTEQAGTRAILDEAAETLRERGLLTEDLALGKAIQEITVQPARTSLLDERELQAGAMNPMHIARFALSLIKAAYFLRFWSLERIANRMQRRCSAFDAIPGERMVSIYQRLRPFSIPIRRKTLFDSIVLLEFLAPYGLFPRCVFGVGTMPFDTHVWVQSESCILNDDVEFVRQFSPIFQI